MAYSDGPIDSSDGSFDAKAEDNMNDASSSAEEDEIAAGPARTAADDNDVVGNEAV